MEPVRIGVVGCGVIGPSHMAAAVASEHLELLAVADRIEERARAAAERFNVPRVYREGAELLADPDVEAVVLAFPACTRTALALQAFGHGKHVLTEKPVAMNAGEVRQMIAARGDRVAACCSSRFRFPEAAQAAAECIASGALGELRVVRARELRPAAPAPDSPPPPWRLSRSQNGGGILMNWGCYDLDFILGLTGWALRPRTAFAAAWPVAAPFEANVAPGSDAETHYVALVRCEGGAVLTLERGEYMAAGPDADWEFIGDRGSLRMRMTSAHPKVVFITQGSAQEGATARVLWEGEENEGLTSAGPVTDFAQAIREGRPPATSLEQALVVQQISDAIYASAESGECVTV